MKKILYISDSILNEYNSVRDILYQIISAAGMEEYEHVIVKSSGENYNPTQIDYYDKYKMYFNTSPKFVDLLKNTEKSFLERIFYIFRRIIHKVLKYINFNKRYDHKQNLKHIRKIIEKEKPQMIVFLTYSPEADYVKMCVEKNIPYICVLYDTYIGRPNINKEVAYCLESKVINNSEGYYIPDFFFGRYSEVYGSTKIHSLKLPLLIGKDEVIKSFYEKEKEYAFSYFGRIQAFRNGDKIKKIFEDVGIKLDVYTTEKYESDDVFRIHPAKTGASLYNIVAGSKYLVAFDNGSPYQFYLPSKAYLYVSFTKPIIAFGDNESSALKTFFKDYPYFYYHNIYEPVEGLKKFLDKPIVEGFDESVYVKYENYTPEKALRQLVINIKSILENE